MKDVQVKGSRTEFHDNVVDQVFVVPLFRSTLIQSISLLYEIKPFFISLHTPSEKSTLIVLTYIYVGRVYMIFGFFYERRNIVFMSEGQHATVLTCLRVAPSDAHFMVIMTKARQ